MMSSLQKELWGYPFSEVILFKSLLHWICRSCKRSRVSTSSRTDGEENSNSDAHQLDCGIAFEHIRVPIKYVVYFGAWICCKWTPRKKEFAEIFFGVAFQQDLALLEEEQRQKNQADQMPWRSLWAEDLEQAPSAPEWVPMMPQQARFLGCWNLLAHEDLRKTGR